MLPSIFFLAFRIVVGVVHAVGASLGRRKRLITICATVLEQQLHATHSIILQIIVLHLLGVDTLEASGWSGFEQIV